MKKILSVVLGLSLALAIIAPLNGSNVAEAASCRASFRKSKKIVHVCTVTKKNLKKFNVNSNAIIINNTTINSNTGFNAVTAFGGDVKKNNSISTGKSEVKVRNWSRVNVFNITF